MYYANVRFPKAIKGGENRDTLLRLILDKFRYTIWGHAKSLPLLSKKSFLVLHK